MSLDALWTATSGLKATQAAISIVSQNVANAGTAGYVRRSIETQASAPGNTGVAVGQVTRNFDAAALKQLRAETAGAAYTGTRADITAQLDKLYGTPGTATALDGVLNTFTESVQELSANPTSAAARSTVLSNGSSLASQINSAATSVQDLRTGIESQLGTDTAAASTLLKNIATLNNKIQSSTDESARADLQDQRDQAVNSLAGYMDISTVDQRDGTTTVMTASGVTLVDRGNAAALSFDGRGALNANSTYSTDPAKRTVGTITATTPGGAKIDLGAPGALRSGTIAAELELRDTTLPQAQRQLDDLAAGLAGALSDSTRTATVSGNSATVDLTGANPSSTATSGAGLQAGNTLTLTVTDSKNVTRNIILVASNAAGTTADPLPTISPGQTNDLGALTASFSIAGGPGKYLANIQAALSSLTAANPTLPTFSVGAGSITGASSAASSSGGILSIGLTGASGTQALVGASAQVTTPVSTTDTSTGYPQLAFFTDGGNKLFTGSFDSGSQLTGFAQRIAVNTTLTNNSSALTVSSATDSSPSSNRSLQIFNALTTTPRTFSSSSGIGGITAPYSTTVTGFAQDIISAQGGNASAAASLDSTQKVALSTAQGRFAQQSGVNIDEEMSNLIALQTAYGANARVLTAARDMLNQLLQI